jgi:hypothetical protein
MVRWNETLFLHLALEEENAVETLYDINIYILSGSHDGV